MATTRSARILAAAAGWILVLHAADVIVPLSVTVRIWSLPVNLAAILASISYALLPLFSPFRLDRAARLVEAAHAELKQEVSTAWEWARKAKGREREQYSEDLIAALQQRALARLQAVDAASLFPARRGPRACAAVALLALLAAVVMSPVQFLLTIRRYADPAGACGNWGLAAVSPGSVRIAAGHSVLISAGQQPFAVIWKGADGASGTARSQEGTVELSAVLQNTWYRVERGREQSPSFSITVYRPLELTGLRVRVTPPPYSRLGVSDQRNQGDVSGLKGSLVEISATATRRLAQAGLAFDSGVLAGGAIAQDSLVTASFTLRQPGGYRMWAREASGDTLIDPGRYVIAVQEDAFPAVELIAPESDLTLGGSYVVDIEGRASDDFGLSAIALAYEAHGGRKDVVIARPGGRLTDTAFSYRWEVGGLSLLPGDSVVCWLEVRDNDAVSGPKTARSVRRTLRLPDLGDIFKQQELADSVSLQAIEQADPKNASLKSELERLSQAVKESRGLEWQQKAALEDAVKKEQQLLDNVQQAADQALAAMRSDQARFSFDAETMRKMDELRQLFDQAATAEMRQYLETMRQAVEKADRAAVEKALDELKLSQEGFKKRLDAAIASLKQLQQEQKLDLLAKQTDQMLSQQKELKEQAARSTTDAEKGQLAKRQESLAKDTETLEQQMKEQAGEIGQTDPGAAKPLRDAADLLQNNRTAASMRKAGQQLQQRQMTQAGEAQQQAISDLTQAAAGIRQAKSGMRSQRNRAAAQALRQKASDIVRLSRQQEALNHRLGQARESRADLADEQQSLERAAARLMQELDRMGQRAMPLAPQAGAALSQAAQHMKTAGQDAADGRGQQAGDQGQGAQSALNRAAMALMQSASQMNGSAGSGDMTEDMEGLSSRQQALNQETAQAAGQEQELRMQAMQAQIPRLAAEQAAIRQGLQQFNEQYSGRTDRTGRTDDLIQEMDRVIDDLHAGRVTKETQQRQDKILTRMLDAQRSLQERDFSRQRQAQPAADAAEARRIAPRAPATQSWQQRQLWRDWRSQPYPLEYRQMLENYFHSLGQ